MPSGAYIRKRGSSRIQLPTMYPQRQLACFSTASVTDLILTDHYGVAVSVSPANAPPRGPGLWSMPPAIISHPDFRALMISQIQTFLQANPQLSAAQPDGTSSR